MSALVPKARVGPTLVAVVVVCRLQFYDAQGGLVEDSVNRGIKSA